MSVSAQAVPVPRRIPILPRLAVAVAATALVSLAVALLVLWLAPATPAPSRNPFGLGFSDPTPGGALGRSILALQSQFYGSLRSALAHLREDGSAYGPLMGVGFAYGVFHAAGPGHGKAVISSYIVADENALRKGVVLSIAAALVQALVAIGIVLVVSLAFRATAATMNRVATNIELASFVFVALLGLSVTWRKAGHLIGIARMARDPMASVDLACGHAHLPGPEEFGRLTRFRAMAGVALAAGVRPCSGALILLVFALSQGYFGAGILATFAMAAGTALTTSVIAALAVFFKSTALRLAGGRGARGALAMAAIELLAAAFVLVLGVSLIFGLWRLG